jgi:hypothetical protein
MRIYCFKVLNKVQGVSIYLKLDTKLFTNCFYFNKIGTFATLVLCRVHSIYSPNYMVTFTMQNLWSTKLSLNQTIGWNKSNH